MCRIFVRIRAHAVTRGALWRTGAAALCADLARITARRATSATSWIRLQIRATPITQRLPRQTRARAAETRLVDRAHRVAIAAVSGVVQRIYARVAAFEEALLTIALPEPAHLTRAARVAARSAVLRVEEQVGALSVARGLLVAAVVAAAHETHLALVAGVATVAAVIRIRAQVDALAVTESEPVGALTSARDAELSGAACTAAATTVLRIRQHVHALIAARLGAARATALPGIASLFGAALHAALPAVVVTPSQIHARITAARGARGAGAAACAAHFTRSTLHATAAAIVGIAAHGQTLLSTRERPRRAST